MPFSVHTMSWSGEQRAFVVEEFIQNGGSSIMTQRAFRKRIGEFFLPHPAISTSYEHMGSRYPWLLNVERPIKKWLS
jgi:hypothetical protein